MIWDILFCLFILPRLVVLVYLQVEWDTDPGVQEVQSITTSTYTGPNEIQSITTTATAINEIQVVNLFATPVLEEQEIVVTSATGGFFFIELDTSALGGSLQYSGYIETDYPADDSTGDTLGKNVADIISSMTNISPFGSVEVSREELTATQYRYLVTFPESMGNVPQMIVHTTQLTPVGEASATVNTLSEGNIIDGTFTLSFEGETTAAIDSDASENAMRLALESLSTIGSVEVSRSAVDNQRGYRWTIEFTAAMNSGNVPTLISNSTGLTLTNPDALVYVNVSSIDGNQIGGSFTLGFTNNGQTQSTEEIQYDATAAEFKAALEAMPNNIIPPGTIAVSRTGPDQQLGYSWTVSFLSDYNRTFEGDLEPFVFDNSLLTGEDANGTVVEVRKGTVKEVQLVAVTTSATVDESIVMQLNYEGLSTEPIVIRHSNDVCDSSITEIQTITTSTVDTTTAGGDSDVSMYLQFRLAYGNEITSWIDANADANTDCSDTAAVIVTELEKFNFFDIVTVNGTSLGADQSCRWTIAFVSSIGNIDQLQVQSRNQVTFATGSLGYVSVASDDTVTVDTLVDGEKDAIKYALELLDNIGTVTVTPTSATPTGSGECSWLVTFDTNAGDLSLMEVLLFNSSGNTSDNSGLSNAATFAGTTVTITEHRGGTSEVIGGNFALTFRGRRSIYVPYDAEARTIKNILEQLTSIGEVDVTRSVRDENNGYTWMVTFLTELGYLDLIEFDNEDMTGTVVSGVVAKEVVGVSPPFNSLDPVNVLPLGSAIITDLSNLAITVDGLDEGIAFYFRVAAINAVGQGPYAFSSVPFAIPQSQRPSRPSTPMLELVDGSTLEVSFNPPDLDGGEDVTFYRIEYANSAFAAEVQEVNAECSIVNEIQILEADTSKSIPEVQLLFISTTFNGTEYDEVQTVTCDATGGSFRLNYNGYTTQSIPYDADVDAIADALQQLEIINTVSVAFTDGVSTACFERTAATFTGGFQVTFLSVVDQSGDLPLMTATTNNLQGARFIYVNETQKGDAGIGGTFRLSFRGAMTEDISAEVTSTATTAADIAAKLGQLDTIPVGGVSVSWDPSFVDGVSQLWRITFTSAELGGDVEAIEPVRYFNRLTGSGVSITVLTDGLETAEERGYATDPSVQGNEISGTFTLTYRGHTTEEIDFNVADNVLKARIEALPNINTVNVVRTGPSVYKEYSWAITFLSMPGSYPDGSENVLPLEPAYDNFGGIDSVLTISEYQNGSDPLGGTFSLIMTTPAENSTLFNVTDTAGGIPADASASELEGYLNALETIGTVSVSRSALVNGFQWLVTFDGCKIVNGADVCNLGNVPLLSVNNSLMQCAAAPVSTREVVRGSGPATNCNDPEDPRCFSFVTDISGPTPYTRLISDLTAGLPYYVRVAAHNSIGYGYPAHTVPEFQIPTFNPPGAPPPVRLVSSTSTSITVEWDYPRENGGATVQGFQLWMDDWAGGNARLAFDGIDQPDVTEFTVSATTSFVLESGRSYKFTVRAINYCFATNPDKACLSEFSQSSVFTVRAPRAPLAPPQPYRHAKSDIGTQSPNDANIVIRWEAALDNGGSPLTGYNVYWAAPGDSSYTEEVVGLPTPVTNDANGIQVFEWTLSNAKEGNVYRFYVVSVNKIGKSAASPIVSILAGMWPGVDAFRTNLYGSIAPVVTSVSSTEIALYWPMPSANATGSIPITGYKVYSYAGVGLNTLANPQVVFNEVQQVQTTVNARSPAVQQITFPDSVTTFSLSAYGFEGAQTLSSGSSTSDIATYLTNLLSTVAGFENMAPTVTSMTYSSASSTYTFTVEFDGVDGIVEDLVVATFPVTSTSAVSTISAGTEKIEGSFTLSYQGHMSVDLPYNVSAEEMKASLEDVPGVGTVSVNRTFNYIDGEDRGAFTWLITFDTAPGNLPMLYATPGRLTPLESGVAISVTQIVQGTDVALVYDGTGIPEVRTAIASNLVPDNTYAFKVIPLNALGDGVLSQASTTVVARSGASPLYSTATGSSLATGITYSVDEQQVITTSNCRDSNMTIHYGSTFANFSNSFSEAKVDSILENSLGTGTVEVYHEQSLNGSVEVDKWRIVFIASGDVPGLSLNAYSSGCSVSVEEFIKGSRNQFTIEPKTASGDVLKDVSAAAGFEGQDVFFVETFHANGSFYRDQGVAAYNPQVYEVQQITIDSGFLGQAVVLELADYLTPHSEANFSTASFTSSSTPFDVQEALQTLPNVDQVDVARIVSDDGDVNFLITFMTNLGDLPMMTSSSGVEIKEIAKGVSEVQTITVASDQEFTREEKLFKIDRDTTTTLSISFLDSIETVEVDAPFTADKIESAIEYFYGPNGAPVDVNVGMVDYTQDAVNYHSFTVTFISPVGDVGVLPVNASTDGGSVFTPVTIVESVKGVAPISGTFTIFFEGQYTDDLDHDASAAQVKDALESLSTIGDVKVYREDQMNGYKWTVSFSQNVGNLRMMEASDYRYEIQRLWTEGGTPTPLNGQIEINFGGESVLVDYDATAFELQSALESMPSVGHVEVSRDTFTNGQFSWLITFRDLIGNIENLGVSNQYLFGSDASVYIEEIVAGNNDTLIGPNPTLNVYEKEAGKPDYTAVYTINEPGSYSTQVTQLFPGGLKAEYYDNQWFYGSPSIERIDPTIDFDWSTGLVTEDSNDYVSVTWSGKIQVPKTETYTFYLTADDSAMLYLDHELLIDASEVCCIEHRAQVTLEAGVFYDIQMTYVELTGTAAIELQYSSNSLKKQIIPADQFWSGTPIVGGPFATSIIPGGADYPFTTAFGEGLTYAVAGKPAFFHVQTKDSDGNNQTVNFEDFNPVDLLTVTITDGTTIYYADMLYLGEGLFEGTYTPLRAGDYSLSIQMGEQHIHCGLGEANKCSPFDLLVVPGPSIPQVSEVESPSTEAMDYLIEAVVGEYGTLFIQAKDAFGNNQIHGGDPFKVIFTLNSDESVQYRGTVDDHGDGTYTVRYTIPTAGHYDVAITLESSDNVEESILTCVAAYSPYVYDRYYDGVDAWVEPEFCTLDHPTLLVVHNDLSPPATTYNDAPDSSLAYAMVGIMNSFTIEARDIFGNLRRGDNTTNFYGYGDGESDYFLVEFTQPETNDYYRRSSAIDHIVAENVAQGTTGFFRLSFGGRTTDDIPSDISASGLESILEKLHDYQLDVIVEKTVEGTTTTWAVEFLTMLNVWQSMPPSGPSTGKQLSLVQPTGYSSSDAFYDALSIVRPASRGIYPLTFTLWQTGTYSVKISNNGQDITGSPTTIFVENAPVDPTSSIAYGQGLLGGIAGEQIEITIQAKDTRQTAIQYITTSAELVDYVDEVQSIAVGVANGNTFELSFRGRTTGSFTVGTSTYADVATELDALGTVGSYSLQTDTGADIEPTDTVVNGATFRIKFEGSSLADGSSDANIVGPLPAIVPSSSSVEVTRIIPGDAPFRKPVQAVQCFSASSVTASLSLNGQTVSFSTGSATLSAVANSMETTFGVGGVTMTNPDSTDASPTAFCGSGKTILVQFDDARGAISQMTSDSSAVTVSVLESDGALSGIFPMWGTFTLGFKGENTTDLSFDASADEVESALEALYSIGDITVVKDVYGYPTAGDGVTSVYASDAANYLHSTWTVFFNGTCDGNFDGVASNKCPASLGDEPVIYVNNENIQYSDSAHFHQDAPVVVAKRSLKGYGGNNRLNHDDIDALSVTVIGRTTSASIGMNSVQVLRCYLNTENPADSSMWMQFLNTTFAVDVTATVDQFEDILNAGLEDYYQVSVSSESTHICRNDTVIETTITFTSPTGETLPLIQVIRDVLITADVYPSIQAVDSTTIVEGSPGLYSIKYTPTIHDLYDLNVRINGVDVSNDLTVGVEVLPALEYSATSTHNISQVNVEGVREYFTVQLRDRFGNELIGPHADDSQFVLTFEGDSDICQSDSQSGFVSSTIPLHILDDEPYTDGIYTMYYDPTITGRYNMSVKLLTRGGLLATYYKKNNMADAVLASSSHLHDGLYHDPYWCDGLQTGNFSTFWAFGATVFCDLDIEGCGCDSTRLDDHLSFDWGTGTPLPYDETFTGEFPNDFFSIKWEGFITAPGTGTYTFTLSSDYGAKMIVNGVEYINASPLSTASVSFSVALTANELNTIEIVYYHNLDESSFQVTWSGPGIASGTVLSGDYLSYSRHIINSPIQVEIYPGEVDSTTTSATGSGLTDCTTLTECSFVIQARDSSGNNIYNWGNQEWNISLFGIGDWAGFDKSITQINDVNYTGVQHLNYSVEALGWEEIGVGSTFYGSRELRIENDVSDLLERGDTVIILSEAMLVADEGVFDVVSGDSSNYYTVVPLSRPYLGDNATSVTIYKVENCTAGKYLVTYTPNVRGYYQISLRTLSVNEVQFVEILSEGDLGGNYTLTVVSQLNGKTVSATTEDLLLGSGAASSEAAIALALRSLTNVYDVSVNVTECDSTNCRFYVEFLNMDQNIPPIQVYSEKINGNALKVQVTEVVHGTAAQHMIDSPFTLTVAPNKTDAKFTNAYGEGLVYGVTGVTSHFKIQSKDSFGNNRLYNQPRDIYKVHAFIAERDFDAEDVAVEGSVVHASLDDPIDWTDSRGFSCSDYAAMSDARSGECTSGDNCGCGSTDNEMYVGAGSYGLTADQACCACKGSCGGLYDVTYTPTISGTYTVAVMHGYQLEVQNISTNWTSVAGRSGYFQLSYGECSLLKPCNKTKRIAWDADGKDVEEALEELPGVGDIHVTFTQTTDFKNSAWLITFLTACDMRKINLHEGTVPVSIATITEGECAIIQADNDTHPFPYVNDLLVEERQQIDVTCPGGDTFKLTFRGHTTAALDCGATALQVENALTALSTVGSVDVEGSSSGDDYTYVVTFRPTDGYTLAHIENYGDLPDIIVDSGDNVNSVTVLESGSSPFTAYVEAITINAAHSTAIHTNSKAGVNGLRTGIYLDTTSFIIESRDQFSNRVFYGPVSEVQVIETYTDSSSADVAGSFTLTYRSHTVEVAAQAGIAEMQAALESLPSIGSVEVSTNSVKVDSGLTGAVVSGAVTIDIDGGTDPASQFQVGDWIRIKDATDGPVYTVTLVDTLNSRITISSPYTGYTETCCVALYSHPRNGYQYIVTFDSNLGDLPAITIDDSELIDSDRNPAHGVVISCNELTYQVVETSANSPIDGTFTLQMGEELTYDMPFNISADGMKAALEAFDAIYTVDIEKDGPFGNNGFTWTITFIAYDQYPTKLYAEGKLLQGLEATVTVNGDWCPSTSISGTTATASSGNLGETFMATLDGQALSKANVTYDKDGFFDVVYDVPRLGTYNLTVAKADRGGLYGEYFSNRWLLGVPQETRVDPVINFMWSADQPLIKNAKDYVSARWTGYLLPAFSEVYDFSMTVDDGVRIWVDDVLLLDAFNNSVDSSNGPSTFVVSSADSLIAGQLVPIKIEYREDAGEATIILSWSSTSQPTEVIPTYRMFPSTVEIVGSPFQITPTGRKPTPVQDVVLSIASWNQLYCNFTTPEDDGGSEIVSYTVEWYDASADHTPLEVQSIKMSTNVVGGTFTITSPGGFEYPYDVPYDVDAATMEYIIERLEDVDDVTVTADTDSESRIWRITFITDVGDVADLMIDGTNLVLQSTADTEVVCTDGEAFSASANLNCASDDSINGQNNTIRVFSSGMNSSSFYPAVNTNVGSQGFFSYVINGLIQNSAVTDGYGVRVFATNSEGWSSISTDAIFLKPMAVPLATKYIEVLRAEGSDNSVIAYWAFIPFSDDRAAPVTQFSLQWATDADFSDPEGVVLGSDASINEYRLPDSESRTIHSHNITGLVPGQSYWVRVAGINTMGIGEYKTAEFVVFGDSEITPYDKPDAIPAGSVRINTIPASDAVSVLEASTSIKVAFNAPADMHGSEVTSYWVEWWDTNVEPEVHLLEVSGDLSGSFRLVYNDEITDYIPHDSNADVVRTALESLKDIRSVKVIRQAAAAGGFTWAVTYLHDFPSVYNRNLSVDASGLDSTAGLTAQVTVAYSAMLPHGYNSTVLTASSEVTSYSYVITDLQPGVGYYVKVTPINDKGYGNAQSSVPKSIAPPVQKPSEPLDVYLITNGPNSLNIFYKHPESNGGDNIAKYKIEWDLLPSFDSSGGSPVGSHYKLKGSGHNCTLAHCSYTISGLEKGTPYYVRVFSYNSYGFSVQPGIPVGEFEVPKTQPERPAKVYVEPVVEDALQVTIVPPADNGGAEITAYKVEWDVLGNEAYNLNYLSAPRKSLLYNPYAVQRIITEATDFSLEGYFYVSFGGFSSSPIAVDATAEEVDAALRHIPTVGDIKVTRVEDKARHGYTWSVTFFNSEWWIGNRFFDVPQMGLSNLDGTLVGDFNWTVASSVDDSTFSGNGGNISVVTTVEAMAGFEQQAIRVEATSGFLNGTFALSYNDDSTPHFTLDVTAEELEAALSVLSMGQVIVRKRNFFESGQGFTIYVVFVEQLGNAEMMHADITKLYSTDGSATINVLYSEVVNGIEPIMESKYKNSTVIEVDSSNSGPIVYTIPDLDEGLDYHVRVSAWNGVGAIYGNFMGSTPALVQPSKNPLTVGDISLVPMSDEKLKVSWKAPTSFGGSKMERYTVDYDFRPAVSEVQRVTITSSSAKVTGSFCLAMRGVSTSTIPYSATASRVEAALESLTNIGNVIVTQALSEGSTYSVSWSIEFVDNVGDLPMLSVSCNNLVGDGVNVVVTEKTTGVAPLFNSGSIGIFERPLGNMTVEKTKSVQTITVNSSSVDLNGFFYVVNAGETSQPIDVYSSADDMKYYLESMLTITSVDVTMVDHTLESDQRLENYGRSWIVTFQDSHYQSLLVTVGGKNGTVTSGGSIIGTTTMAYVERTESETLPTYVEIDGLTANQLYVARIKAYNGFFWSGSAISPIAGAPKTSTATPPRDVYMSSASSSEILVWWNAPADHGGAPITGYLVQWDTSANFGVSSHSALVQDGMHYTISGLNAGTAYTVRVAAYNAQGYSAFTVAQQLIQWAPVTVVTAGAADAFTLTFDDGYRTETTTTLDWNHTADSVQAALHRLDSVRSVLVDRFDQSVSDLFDETSTEDYLVSFKVTFLSAGFGAEVGTLTVNSASSSITVNATVAGSAADANFITTTASAPSAPENVIVSVVSDSELGVRWNAPTFDGGLPITKFLIEWDYDPYFTKTSGHSYSQVITTEDAWNYIPVLANYSFQITGLSQLPTYVRVSAFNLDETSSLGGYSVATAGFPINSTDCNTMPVHCSATPAKQVLYLPIDPYVQLSYQEVANRLEVSWQQPTHDQFGFRTRTVSPHTPDTATAYRLQWSTKADFDNSTFYNVQMVEDDNTVVTCANNCSITIGEEVQNVTVASGNGFDLDGGSFMLLYVGKQTRNTFLVVREESDVVTLLDYNLTVAANDFFRIAGQLYQVESVNSSDTIILTTVFTGGFSDITKAYYIPCPSNSGGGISTLDHDATAAEVEAHLDSQFIGMYPLYSDIFTVARKPAVNGYSWLVTFAGEMFTDNVDSLVVVSSDIINGLSTTLTDPFSSEGSRTYLAKTQVSIVINAGDLAAGDAVFVRVIAVNSRGMGPGQLATVSDDGNALGALTPRSPPGLPVNVLVFAVPSSDGSVLKVTWDEGIVYGSPVTSYTIEWSDDHGATFPNTLIIDELGSNKSFQSLIPVTPYDDYIVRVRAHNDQGDSGPRWFQFIGSLDINAVTTTVDFNSGAQRCTPTCYTGLDECSEDHPFVILSRGLPGPSPLLVPTYPQIDTQQSFTRESGLIYFTPPVRNGEGIDKWRVEWDTDSSFTSMDLQTMEVPAAPDSLNLTQYNITGLTMGNTYYIRVVAHHTGGYGEPSSSYPFKPQQQSDPPFEPSLFTADFADDLVTYARSLERIVEVSSSGVPR